MNNLNLMHEKYYFNTKVKIINKLKKDMQGNSQISAIRLSNVGTEINILGINLVI